MRCHQLNPYLDYHPPYPLSCEALVFLMVWRLLYIFPNSPYFLNYNCNGRFPTLTIHSNLLWSLIIAPGLFINKLHPPTSSFIFIVIAWIIIRQIANDLFWSVPPSTKLPHPQPLTPPYIFLLHFHWYILKHLLEAWKDDKIPCPPLFF